MVKNWANILTWTRLLAIIPLTALAHLGWLTGFLVLYIIAALTDLVDGPIARWQKVSSKKGADFDGGVDLAFIVAGLWWLWVIKPTVYTEFWPYFLIVVVAFIAFFITSQIKLGKPATPHLWSGKLGMALFAILIPVTVVWGVVPWYIHATWIVGVLGRVEMIIFLLRGGKDMDTRSAFWK